VKKKGEGEIPSPAPYPTLCASVTLAWTKLGNQPLPAVSLGFFHFLRPQDMASRSRELHGYLLPARGQCDHLALRLDASQLSCSGGFGTRCWQFQPVAAASPRLDEEVAVPIAMEH
jgi:hypothetical protein